LALSNLNVDLLNDGGWDEISPPPEHPEGLLLGEWLTLAILAVVAARRGEDPTPYLDPIMGYLESESSETVEGILMASAEVALLQADAASASERANRALELSYRAQGAHGISDSLHLALAACLELDDLDEADRLLAFVAAVPEDSLPPIGRAHYLHDRARPNSARGLNENCEADFLAAIAISEQPDLTYELAEMRLPFASWLADQGRDSDALMQAKLAEGTLERLRAAVLLERARRLMSRLAPNAAAIAPS
jgi:hypothetical protein